MAKNNRGSQQYEQQAHAAKHMGGRRVDRHFHELSDLAAEGNAEAVQDLWLQYEYDFASRAAAVAI